LPFPVVFKTILTAFIAGILNKCENLALEDIFYTNKQLSLRNQICSSAKFSHLFNMPAKNAVDNCLLV